MYNFRKRAVKLPQRQGAPPPNPRWPPAAGYSTPRPRVFTPTYRYTFVDVRF